MNSTEYRLTWEIDADGPDPIAAAEKVFGEYFRPGLLTGHFSVEARDGSSPLVEVDLSDETKHVWSLVSPGEYDSTYECLRCGLKHMESADNPDSKVPQHGCEAKNHSGTWPHNELALDRVVSGFERAEMQLEKLRASAKQAQDDADNWCRRYHDARWWQKFVWRWKYMREMRRLTDCELSFAWETAVIATHEQEWWENIPEDEVSEELSNWSD